MTAAAVIEALRLGLAIWAELVAGKAPHEIDLDAALAKTTLIRQAARARNLIRTGGAP